MSQNNNDIACILGCGQAMVRLTAAGVAAALLFGCSVSPVSEQFGAAARQVVQAQAVSPKGPTPALPAIVEGADANMVNEAVQAMRKDVPTRKEVKQAVTINVGNTGVSSN